VGIEAACNADAGSAWDTDKVNYGGNVRVLTLVGKSLFGRSESKLVVSAVASIFGIFTLCIA
jgi:hypothetical protein